VAEEKPSHYRSLSSKFSLFTTILLLWMVAMVILWDIREHSFNAIKGVLLCVVVALVASAISRFTIRALARPLILLQRGITSVRLGKFEPIQVSRTGDEIEFLGESFNLMIRDLAASQVEIQQHRELLEERIRQRTEELERAMRAALAASQAKSEFLANMSHELRTPMNGLLGMLDVVLDSEIHSEQKDQLETAQRCAYSLLALLNDILDLSKIEAGKMMMERIPFNIHTVLEDCVKSYMAKATQKRITLTFEFDERAPEDVMGDPLRLRQIVTNLISNAVKFTDRGGVVVRLSGEKAVPALRNGEKNGEKKAARAMDQVVIQVIDSGTGIEKDKLPAIFDKFTQADGSISRKYGGTGLGLAITKRLVELQHGQVTVNSELGQGSTFTVKLPCQIVNYAQPVARPVPQERTSASVIRAGRILLAEDNVVNQKVVMAILKRKGYTIDIANNGQEALQQLERFGSEYGLILMDVQMPVLDGLETTRIIRQDQRWQRLPIIAMTAHAMNGDRERCLNAGMNDYVSKPVQPAHLKAVVENYLNAEMPETGKQPVPATPSKKSHRLMPEESAMVNDLLRVFLQLAPERIGRLEAAASREDATRLAIEASKIAAAAEQLTSTSLEECAQRIARAAAREDFEAALQDLDQLRHEIQSLEALTT
jgi:signal transduction histidine kinase/DNA-binding response OmpR family regulator